jgi:uncharacterized protein YbjT (DUF2867 family)
MQNSESNRSQTVPKILVLGATGGTGRLIVRQAVARGHDVNVLVRSPETARDLKGAKLIIGDARDEKALHKALNGRDSVVCALGTPASPFREVTLLSSATRALASRPAAIVRRGTRRRSTWTSRVRRLAT